MRKIVLNIVSTPVNDHSVLKNFYFVVKITHEYHVNQKRNSIEISLSPKHANQITTKNLSILARTIKISTPITDKLFSNFSKLNKF
jgi:hypothetical protein